MLGILSEGEVPSAAAAEQGLWVLENMFDSWLTEKLLVYVVDRQSFALQAFVQTYGLGPGGVWNTTPLYGAQVPRPVRIERASWRDPATGFEQPLGQSMTDDEYQNITVRNTTGTQVLAYHYNPSFPLGEVFVWPIPTLSTQMVLYLWHPWNPGITLDTVVSFPPGYQYAIETNLSIDLGLYYPGALRAELVAVAVTSKAKVKALNHKTGLMTSDAAVVTAPATGTGGLYTGWTDFLAGRS